MKKLFKRLGSRLRGNDRVGVTGLRINRVGITGLVLVILVLFAGATVLNAQPVLCSVHEKLINAPPVHFDLLPVTKIVVNHLPVRPEEERSSVSKGSSFHLKRIDNTRIERAHTRIQAELSRRRVIRSVALFGAGTCFVVNCCIGLRPLYEWACTDKSSEASVPPIAPIIGQPNGTNGTGSEDQDKKTYFQKLCSSEMWLNGARSGGLLLLALGTQVVGDHLYRRLSRDYIEKESLRWFVMARAPYYMPLLELRVWLFGMTNYANNSSYNTLTDHNFLNYHDQFTSSYTQFVKQIEHVLGYVRCKKEDYKLVHAQAYTKNNKNLKHKKHNALMKFTRLAQIEERIVMICNQQAKIIESKFEQLIKQPDSCDSYDINTCDMGTNNSLKSNLGDIKKLYGDIRESLEELAMALDSCFIQIACIEGSEWIELKLRSHPEALEDSNTFKNIKDINSMTPVVPEIVPCS